MLTTDKNFASFFWNRIILDTDGCVLTDDMSKLDPDWKGKSVIWKDVEESDGITLEII